jgi:histidinol-phosphate aminotransferase
VQNQTIYQLAGSGVQQLVPYQPGKPVTELQRELGLEKIIKLASNENPLGPGPKTVAAIQSALPELARYPDGSGFALKRALSAKHNLATEQITLGNGSNEILELLARTFLTPESEVIFSQHSFAVYPLVTQAVGAKGKSVPALNYGHDLDAMLAAVTANTRMVFIANPNNPTGIYIQHSEVEAFIKALPEQVLCVLDEAYYEFVDTNDHFDSVTWLDHFPNLIITRTFSKAYGLAGLRVGYGLSSSLIADLLNRVRQPFNNNTLALVAAEAALADQEYLQKSVQLNRQGMKQLTDAFTSLGLPWLPSSGNFVSVDVKREAMPIYESLLRKGVIVRPVANYEMPHHLRISIGTYEENKFFIDAFTAVVNN